MRREDYITHITQRYVDPSQVIIIDNLIMNTLLSMNGCEILAELGYFTTSDYFYDTITECQENHGTIGHIVLVRENNN